MACETMDRLTRAATAFGSWAELEEALRGGYAPTLRAENPNTVLDPEQKQYEAAVSLLASHIRARGYRTK